MSESFIEKRKRELGIAQDNGSDKEMSFTERRKIELGMAPDTRPKAKTTAPNTGKSITELKKILPPQLTAADPVAASSLMRAVNGDQSSKATVEKATGIKFQPNTKPKSQYEIENDEIENSNSPDLVKEIAKKMNWITRGNPVGNFLSQATNIPGVSVNPVDSTGNKTADTVGGWLGKNAAPMLVPSGAPIGAGTIGAPYSAAQALMATNKGQKVVDTVAKAVPFVKPGTAQAIAKGALTEGMAGAVQMPAQRLVNDSGASGKELLSDSALGAAGGLVLGGVGGGLGRVASVFSHNRAIGKALNDVIEHTDLPVNVPKGRALETSASTGAKVDNYVNRLGQATEPTKAKLTQQTNPYRQKFESLMAEAQQTPMRAGYEREALEDLWSRRAVRTDPSLDELIALAYPTKASKITPDLATKAKNRQYAREVAGVPSIINSKAGTSTILDGNLPFKNVPEAKTFSDPYNFNNDDIPEFLLRRARSGRGLSEPDITPIESAATVEVPQMVTPPSIQAERGFARTLKASEKTPNQFVDQLESNYKPITNEETVAVANQRVSKDVEEATNYVLGDTKFDATKSATAQRLIDHYNQQGNYKMAVSIADKVATEATTAGQFIQSLSIYNRLTPEGVLIRAQQIANKVNERLPVGKKGAHVTEDMAAELTELAGITQKMTGVKELSNDVMDILSRAKSGEKLTSAETDNLQRFVNESKQFIKETTKKAAPKDPKLPKEMSDKRVRDNVVSFLDAQEQAARERIKARGNRISSTPLDVYADYAVIGASKLGKGVVKFADWSEAMVKDFGDDIKPILANLYNRSEETLRMSAKKISSQTISNAERLTEKVIRTKDLTTDEADSLMVLARRVSGLSGEEKRLASQDLQAILQGLDNPSIWRKVSSTQTMAQLLNPKTQVRNVLGNELFYRAERLNKLIATPIDIARSKLTGTERYVTFKTHNQGQFWKNFLEGGKAGWKGVNINGLNTQFDLAGPAFRGKYNPMTYFEKALGASLRSFDNAAYMRAYNNTLGELGTLDAVNKGIKPTKEYIQDFIARADDNIMQMADHYGKYVTFQDNNMISRGMTTFKRGLNKATTGSIDFGAGDLILKYPKTPGALLMRAFEYSPAGFLRSAHILYKGARFAEKNPAEATVALTRAILGTGGFMGMGYVLMDKGILTGQASKDKDIRALQSSTGQGQYQVNLSALQRFITSGFDTKEAKIKENDLLYTYDWMQPVSVALSMGANIQSSLSDKKGVGKVATGALGSAYNSISGGINTLTEQSLLKGISDAFSSAPGQTITDKIVDILSDMPASFVPTAFNQVKQLTDNSKRETYSPDKMEQTLNKVQAKIPGLAGKLPKQYDTLGQEKKHYQNNSAMNVLLNPGFPTRYKLSPEAKMIVDLITETGDETLAPRVPGKSVAGNKLTGEQFSRFSQLQGEETAKRIGKIDPNKKTSTKVKKAEKALTKSSDFAKKQLIKEFDLQKIK